MVVGRNNVVRPWNSWYANICVMEGCSSTCMLFYPIWHILAFTELSHLVSGSGTQRVVLDFSLDLALGLSFQHFFVFLKHSRCGFYHSLCCSSVWCSFIRALGVLFQYSLYSCSTLGLGSIAQFIAPALGALSPGLWGWKRRGRLPRLQPGVQQAAQPQAAGPRGREVAVHPQDHLRRPLRPGQELRLHVLQLPVSRWEVLQL